MRPAAAAAALTLLWMLPGLFGHDPWKPDEAYTFGLVLDILQTGDWVVPTLAGEPFLEKPPAFFLSAALFARLFGGGWLALHDAARLATAFYMALTFLCVALAARQLYGGGKGWIAVLLLAGSVGLIDRGHQLITDTAQLAGIALGIYGFALSLHRPLFAGLALGTGTGLAFLAKGLFAPGCLAVAALALPALSPPWRARRYVHALAVAALAALPWLVIWPAALHARRPELLDEWLWGMNVGSFIGEESIAAKPSAFFYLWVLPWFALPSWPLAAWTVWQARGELRARAQTMLCLALLGVMFLVLSVSKTGRELYAMPLLIPLCLLAAPALAQLPQRLAEQSWRTALIALALAGGALWLAWLSLELGLVSTLQTLLLRRQPAYAPRFDLLAFSVAAAYTGLVVYIVRQFRRRPERPIAAWSGAVSLAWGLSMILFLRYLDTGKSYRAMIADLSRALPPVHSCIASRSLGEPQRALLRYFAGITTYRQEGPLRRPDCELLLVQGSRETFKAPDAHWAPVWEGARPGDAKELYRLYRRVSPS